MARLIKFPGFDEQRDPIDEADMVPTAVDLPPKYVIDAGVRKFIEMAKLYWPSKGGVVAFDTKNSAQLSLAMGMVYLAMREAETQE